MKWIVDWGLWALAGFFILAFCVALVFNMFRTEAATMRGECAQREYACRQAVAFERIAAALETKLEAEAHGR